MPLKLPLSICLLGTFLVTSAHAQEAVKGVVELFTSQGCASCPPADEALRKMIQKGDVVGLSYHVDYWNYLGWTDPWHRRKIQNGNMATCALSAATVSIRRRPS